MKTKRNGKGRYVSSKTNMMEINERQNKCIVSNKWNNKPKQTSSGTLFVPAIRIALIGGGIEKM